MDDQQQDPVLRALGWGSFAGSLPLSFLLFIELVADGDPFYLLVAILIVAISAFPISFLGILIGLLVIALPLTKLLRHLDQEEQAIYTSVGLLAPTFLFLFELGEAGLLLGISGMFAGTTSAAIWGGWRAKLAKSRNSNAPDE